MWKIKSQDGTVLINASMICSIGKKIYASVSSEIDATYIGTYASGERAKEVIKLIMPFYEPDSGITYMPQE